jgi:pyruvate/2-oxoglutarate dehydrogenase complex dihydrolipoamide acyltransferase (E2) component
MATKVKEAADDTDNERGRRRQGSRGRFRQRQRRRRTRHRVGLGRCRDQEERADRPHRRSGAHVPARNGLGGASVARRRNRHRQAHRGRPRDHDRGLCESPLTFQAIIIWREELNEGATLLREIIDLETTYSGPEAKAAPQFQSPEKIEADRKVAEEKEKARAEKAPPTTSPMSATKARFRRGRRRRREQSLARRDGSRASPAGDGNARHHCRDLQEAAQASGPAGRGRLAATGTLSPAQERRYKEAARRDLITDGQVAVAQPEPHRQPRRAALRHQQAPGLQRRPPAAPGRKLRCEARRLPDAVFRRRA